MQGRITYFVQPVDGGPIKIGKASDLKKRLIQLQTSHFSKLRVLATIEGDLEKELHHRFHRLRLNGEWFKPEAELRQYLSENFGITDLSPAEYRLHPPFRYTIPFADFLSGCMRRFGCDKKIDFDKDSIEMLEFLKPEEFSDPSHLNDDYDWDNCDCEYCCVEKANYYLTYLDSCKKIIWSSEHMRLGVLCERDSSINRKEEFDTLSDVAYWLDSIGVETFGVSYSRNTWDACYWRTTSLFLNHYEELPLPVLDDD